MPKQPLPTRESILALLAERPHRMVEIAPSRSPGNAVRKAASEAVKSLKADGLIRQQYLDAMPYLTLIDWKPDAKYFQLRVDERCKRTVDGCLEWIGARNHHGNPVMRFDDNKPKTVRHWLWHQHRGRQPNAKTERIYMTCMNEDCVEPSHMMLRKANFQHKGKTRTMASIIRMSIAGQRKITREDARAIRASTEGSRVLAQRYGVSQVTINQIRRGQTHKEPAMMMFSQLLAA